MKERRRIKRIKYHGLIDFSVSVLEFKELKRLNLNGTGIDINDAGIGIHVDYPLESGHVLRFNGIGQKAGIVKWSMKFGNTYRIGIIFVQKAVSCTPPAIAG
ncbi:MAG: hypothetical protein FJ242_01040 [Nitrospira sp.]|nr:hypothetical protein [Nitrospira sp.]